MDARHQPAVNRCLNPRGTALSTSVDGYQISTKWGGDGGSAQHSWVTAAADGPDGITTYRRSVWTVTPPGPAQDIGGAITRYSGGATLRDQAVAGQHLGLTLALRMTVEAAPSALNARLRFYNAPSGGTVVTWIAGDNRISDYEPDRWLIFGFEHTVTRAEAGSFLTLDVVANFPAGAIQVGDTRDVTRGHLGTTATYIDGSMPGARWLGNIDRSESVGYPPVDNAPSSPGYPPPRS